MSGRGGMSSRLFLAIGADAVDDCGGVFRQESVVASGEKRGCEVRLVDLSDCAASSAYQMQVRPSCYFISCLICGEDMAVKYSCVAEQLQSIVHCGSAYVIAGGLHCVVELIYAKMRRELHGLFVNGVAFWRFAQMVGVQKICQLTAQWLDFGW